ncbi:hypothetical protein EKS23_13325 [Morganella morganii subsp. morganii]|nr:hypothetical protein EKS23_13325 [Morganella morganii subsp. morganii]
MIWLGINKALTKPIYVLIENIKSISTGDLTKSVNVSGCHEITILAETLSNMQYELSNTVGNVRDGVVIPPFLTEVISRIRPYAEYAASVCSHSTPYWVVRDYKTIAIRSHSFVIHPVM